jgi:hypothetical protein
VVQHIGSEELKEAGRIVLLEIATKEQHTLQVIELGHIAGAERPFEPVMCRLATRRIA